MKRNVKMRKKQKQKRKRVINKYVKKIKEHHDKLWCPNNNIQFEKKEMNTWFNIEVSRSNTKKEMTANIKFKTKKEEQLYKCKKVIMHLTYDQKKIMNKWFNSYALMYNETLRLIKKRRIEGKDAIYDYKKLRTLYLKEVKDNIRSFYDDCKKEIAKSHNLDHAIKLACASYKSALDNYKKGNIRHFRIRYWRHNKQNRVMDIEDSCFGDEGLCHAVFGKIKCTYDKKDFDLSNVNITCKMTHDRLLNKYCLFVPEKIKTIKRDHKRQVISCDPGIRTFMTGVTENHVIKMGDKCSTRIKKYLKIIDKRNNMNIPVKIKKKNEKVYNRKITGLVDEMHWKTINYLTRRHKKVLVGDMSVKGITCNKTSKINRMTKRIAYKLKFYKFRQRLEYKCNVRRCEFKVVDESYTSKICSMCGYLNNNLGSSKKYDCPSCLTTMDRDVNGARGIFIKSLYQ